MDFILTLSLVSVTAAADYGLGVSIHDSEPLIYLPINVNDNFRIEPSIYQSKSTYKSDNYESNHNRIDLLVGFFARSVISESVSTYYGGRIGYTSQEDEYERSSGYVDNDDIDGYIIEPALGFEYHFTSNISLGGEVSYQYSKLDGYTGETFNGVDVKTEEKKGSTNTNVVLRYIF